MPNKAHPLKLIAPLVAILVLLGACKGDGNVPPTSAGMADGRPTLVYLWNFP